MLRPWWWTSAVVALASAYMIRELQLGPLGGESTLEEVGDGWDVSRARIRAIEANALAKLRHWTRADHIRDFAKRDAPEFGWIRAPRIEPEAPPEYDDAEESSALNDGWPRAAKDAATFVSRPSHFVRFGPGMNDRAPYWWVHG